MLNQMSQPKRTAGVNTAVLLFLTVTSLVLLDARARLRSLPHNHAANARPALVLQRGHSLGVTCVAFAPDGTWLASGGADNSVLIWQVASGRQLRALTGHVGYIRSVAISSNGQWIASGSIDRTARVWDVATGRELYTLAGHSGSVEALAFSSDGRWLASGSSDKTIKIWDMATGKELRTLTKHTAPVTVLAFSANAASLASAGGTDLIRWDTKSWQDQQLIVGGNTARITAIRFSGDDRDIAWSTSDGVTLVSRNGSYRERFTMKHNASSVLALTFVSDGSVIAGHSDGGIDAWDYHTGKEKWSRPSDPRPEQLVFAVFSSDASILASSTGQRGVVNLRRVATGEVSQTLQSHSNGVNAVAFSSDGRWFGSATNDSSVRLWQVATGRELPQLKGHLGYVNTVAFSPDSRMLASGSNSGEVKVWDVSTTNLTISLPSHSTGINVVEFSPDGKSLATAGLEGTIEIWDLATRQSRSLSGHSEEVTSLVFSDGGRLLISGSRDKTIRTWDLKTGKTIASLTNLEAEINALALSPDGHLLAAANADKSVRLWDMTNATPVRTLSGHTGEVMSVNFSADGQLLASSGADHTVILWDPKSGTNLRQLTGNSETVTGVAFTGNGRWTLTASEDGSMMIWNSSAGTLMATLVSMPNADEWLVAAPDGLFDGSPESWNLMLWRFGGETFNVMPIEAYFNEFYYPGLLADILADKDPKAATDITQKDRRQPRLSMKVGGSGNGNLATRYVDVELEVKAASPDKDHTNSGGAKDLRLFRNGLLVRTWSGDLLKAAHTEILHATIPIVAGENRISAYAFNNDNVKSLDSGVLVNGADSLKRQGTAYLLMIGVERYENPQYNLRYPAADAGEMGAQLREQQEKLGRYNPIITIPLTNELATKRNILLALGRLAGTNTGPLPPEAPPLLSKIGPSQPEDVVVVYFSGHGKAVKDRFYLIPYDLGYKGSRMKLDAAGLDTMLAHSVSDEELEAALQTLDADQLLLIIDACNSGQAVESEEKRRGPMNTRGLAQLAYEKGIYVLTASQGMEVAFESEALKHSYLAYALLEDGLKTGLADGNGDGNIFLKEWFDYANDRVPQIRRKRNQQSKELVEEEADEQKVQRPRVFYTREGGAKRFLVGQHVN